MVIYKIENLINGKIYVGQTRQSPQKRWESHKLQARRAVYKKAAQPIHAAMAKHGIENFTFSVIEECNDLDSLNNLEISWIKRLTSMSPIGYNLQSGGKAREISEETRQKMSDSHIGRKCPWNKKPKSEDTKRKISLSKLGKVGPWAGKSRSAETKKSISESNRKTYKLISPTGELIVTSNIKELAESVGISRSGLQRVATGKRKQCYGWTKPSNN